MKTRELLPPDPEGKNEDRAEWAAAALSTFRVTQGRGYKDEDDDTAVQDLLADICHFCDREGIDFGHALWGARMHYDDETDSKGTQFDRIPITPRPIPGLKHYTRAQVLDAVASDLEAAPAELSLVEKLARKVLTQHVDYVRGEGWTLRRSFNTVNPPLPWPEGGSKPGGRNRISYRAFRDAVAPHGLIPCPALKQWWYRGHQPEEAVAAFRQINTSTADEFIVSTTAGVGQIRTMRPAAGVIQGHAH